MRRGWIGVSYQSVTDDIADSFGLDKARGVLVANVTADGPGRQGRHQAQRHHPELRRPGSPRLRRFPRIVANARVGATVDVVVWRGSKETTLKLRIGEQEEAERAERSAQGPGKKRSPTRR